MLAKNYHYQSLRVAKTKTEFRENSCKNKETFVTTMIRFKKNYIYVLSTGTNWRNLSTIYTWHPQNYNKIGEDGKFVVGLYKHDKLWELQLAANTGVTNQKIKMCKDSNDLISFIKDQWKNGYDVTDLVTSDGKYYVITSLGLNLNQGWAVNSKFSQNDAEKAYKQGLILTEVVQLEDKYLWIFSGNTGFQNQALEFNPDSKTIKTISEKIVSGEGFDGYFLASIREISGYLLFIFVQH